MFDLFISIDRHKPTDSTNRRKTKGDSLIIGSLLMQVQPSDKNRYVPTSRSAPQRRVQTRLVFTEGGED